MKIAFSTLGCPGWRFEEIYAAAKDLRLDGIEIRGIGSQISAAKANIFAKENINDTLRKLGSLKLSLFATSAALGETDRAEDDLIKEAKEHINIASQTSTSFIRVMISSKPEPTDADYDRAVRLYSDICEYGASKGVMPLIETNGILSDSKIMLKFIKDTASQNKGVLWDVHHPYRYYGETPEHTVSILKDNIKYIHVKDSKIEDGKLVYKMMGHGDVPIKAAMKELNNIGYDGFVTLEWVKRWNPDLQEPGIVFSHYASYIKHLISEICK